MLNVKDLVAYTGFSRAHIYKLTMDHVIPHYKPGKKKIFFKKEEIDAWLQTNPVLKK